MLSKKGKREFCKMLEAQGMSKPSDEDELERMLRAQLNEAIEEGRTRNDRLLEIGPWGIRPYRHARTVPRAYAPDADALGG